MIKFEKIEFVTEDKVQHIYRAPKIRYYYNKKRKILKATMYYSDEKRKIEYIDVKSVDFYK